MVRLGAATLGVLIGFVIGFILAIVCVATGTLPEVSFAMWVFGTPALLAIVCFVSPAVAFCLFPGLAHFVAGAASTSASALTDDPSRHGLDPAASSGLKIAFYLGVAAVVLWALAPLFQ
jgi:hypothetical protein